MAFTPGCKVNRHTVRIKDKDVGTCIKEIDIPTGKAFLWYVICMEVQTSGSLRIGERIKVGDAEFEVCAMKDGWYELSTSEIKADKFEMWGVEMLIQKINCHL